MLAHQTSAALYILGVRLVVLALSSSAPRQLFLFATITMSSPHYARDALQNPLNPIHQRRTWPIQCAVCSDPRNLASFAFFFAPTVDSDDHFICCIPLLPPESIPDDDSEIDVVPVVFTMIGQIAPEDCFLTATGDQRESRPDYVQDKPLASCWFESRPDRDSCLEWRQLPSAIDRIASTAVPGPLDTSRVVRFTPNDGAVQLRIRFVPPEGEVSVSLRLAVSPALKFLFAAEGHSALL